jgi:predicted nucleic acid-binding protein
MLLDTSGLYCYLDSSDSRHSNAVALLHSVSKRHIHNYVIAELFIDELTKDPAIAVHWVDRDLHRRAIELLRQRADKTYSLCDAVSFLLMRQQRVTDALTTDHHFEQEGFATLLRS